jgi:HEAT repeat protein
MTSRMDNQLHHEAVQRALTLGRGTDPAALPDIVRLITIPSAEVRRLAASAIGKLGAFGADATIAVRALLPVLPCAIRIRKPSNTP